MSEYDGTVQDDLDAGGCCASAPVAVEPVPIVDAVPPAPVEDVAPAPVETYAPAPAPEIQAAPALETQPAPPVMDSSAAPQPLVIQPAPMEAQAGPGPGAPVDLADLLAPEAQQAPSSAPLVITSDQYAAPAPVNLSDFPIFRTNPDGSQSLDVQPIRPTYDPLGVPAPGRSGADIWSLPEGWGWYHPYRR